MFYYIFVVYFFYYLLDSVFCCLHDLRGLREIHRGNPQGYRNNPQENNPQVQINNPLEERNHNGDATVVAVAALNHGTQKRSGGRRSAS